MSRVLIIGASGLLGRALIDSFSQLPDITIGALSESKAVYSNNSIISYKVDVLDSVSLNLVVKKYDVIVNCIGQITNPISKCFLLNTKGVSNIINSANKYNIKLIHISSISVYGSANYADETSDLKPETPYASMKCFAEYLIDSSLNDYVILRVSNLFGKRQKKGIVNYLERSYLTNNNQIFFNNDGSLKRYYLNIDDLSRAVVQIYTKGILGVYNVIGQDFLTIKDVVRKFEGILNYQFHVTYDDLKPIENIEFIDNSKLDSLLLIDYETNISKYINSICRQKY